MGPESANRPPRAPKSASWKWRIALGYLALLMVSHFVRWARAPRPPSSNDPIVAVKAVDGERQVNRNVQLAFKEYRSSGQQLPAVILIHGSPGHKQDFRSLAPLLAEKYRVIALDLPGFGNSTENVPDYSIRAHARYVVAMMDALGIERANLLGFSMGGGVALNVADIAPDRVASITMLSAIGVQEMELLGDYHVNHALHGAQLAAIWLFEEAIPHFGLFGHWMLDRAYARNFYDSDQRPLRQILGHFDQPMLIVHGKRDVLVPFEAAVEHHRIVPQSEAEFFDDSHFMVFQNGAKLAPRILEFLDRVEQGMAVTRSTADADRIARAALPYDPAVVPKATGVTALVLVILIAAATLVSEDLTCIAAGVMVAQGRMGFVLAVVACCLGIFVGDMLLFLAGRYLGRPALARAPLKWFVRSKDVERSSAWFNQRGIAVIAASRFIPGMRLPTYFAAGLLNTRLIRFSLYFLIAGAVWTPLLVGLSSLLGGEVAKWTLLARQNVFIQLLAAAIAIYLAVKLLIRSSTHRGRRMLLSRWRRLTRWEFWPPWVFYVPVICYVLRLALKHRSLTVFTAANPSIPAGGLIGESKIEILQGLSRSNGFMVRSSRIDGLLNREEKLATARSFLAENNLSFPVVLKPDQGQRGAGVAVIRSTEELDGYLSNATADTIVQEYVSGCEFGVFYFRQPDESRGKIFSITEKRFPEVVGDGIRNLESLILDDQRAVCMARFYLDKHGERLIDVPARGERIQLVEIGTHCRGAVFLDGGWAKTPELETAIDEISRGFDGFYFGRYDVRAASVEDFKAGRNFKVIELNGVTSEATHIYDPKNSLLNAYRVLFEQWSIAFEIGAKNLGRGVKPSSIREAIKMLVDYRRHAMADSSSQSTRFL